MKGTRFSGSFLILFVVVILGIPAIYIYNLPPIQERISWRVAELMARIKYTLSPPEEAIFVPEEDAILPTKIVTSTSILSTPLPANSTPGTPSNLPRSLPIPTQTLTPIPESILLTGIQHEYQTWNNCGPATLAMALSYWKWEGNQRIIADFTKPNPRDKM